jgi:hypothetical protein
MEKARAIGKKKIAFFVFFFFCPKLGKAEEGMKSLENEITRGWSSQ